MYIQEKSRKPGNSARFLDGLHIVIGLLIVALAVVSFFNPEGHMLLFPVIFFLAALLHILNGIFRLRICGRGRKKKVSGLLALLLGILLLALTVISAVSIWWG